VFIATFLYGALTEIYKFIKRKYLIIEQQPVTIVTEDGGRIELVPI